MLNILKKIISPEKDPNKESKRKCEVAAAALYIDMAKADTNYSDDEREQITLILKNLFHEDDEYIEQLMEDSEAELRKSISTYEFASEINKYFTQAEKYELIKNLWRIIFTDDTVDIYEEHLLKQIAGTLNLDRQDIIASKIEVKEELNTRNKPEKL